MARDEDADTSRRFLIETGVAAKVAELAEPLLLELGFRLVRVQLTGRDGQTLQIMAERPDGRLSADECARISRALSPVLDAYDPVPGAYRLEVSSPGIDRPLVRAEDFERWAGHEVRIELSEPVGGQKRFRGVIEGYSDGEARIETELAAGKVDAGSGHVVLGLPLNFIHSARLVLTDRLLRLAAQKQAGDAEVDEFLEHAASAERTALDEVESGHGPGRRKRKPAGAAADRGRRRKGKIDRPADRDRGDGGRDPEGG